MSQEPRAVRVCMVHQSDYHIDSRIQRQARALTERGGEVDCVCLSDSAEFDDAAGRIRLHRIDPGPERTGARGYLTSYSRFLAGALVRVAQLHRRRPFDVVEADNMPNVLVLAGLIPKLRGVPIVLDVHDTFPELFTTKFGVRPGSAAHRAVLLEERLSAAMADALLVVTEEARLRLASRDVGRGKTFVVMNTPDEAVFGPQRPPVTWAPSDRLRAVYHGGLAERFGPEVLLQAFAQLGPESGIELDIYGSDEERVGVAARAGELVPGDQVRVAAEPVPFQEIPAKLEAAHIGIVPTLRDEFTELLLPVKLIEYVHMGLPVVCPRLPVIEHYFSDEDVAFFEPGDAISLADAVRRTVADPVAASRRAAAAAIRIDDIAWHRQRDEYVRVLDALAASHAPSSASPVRLRTLLGARSA